MPAQQLYIKTQGTKNLGITSQTDSNVANGWVDAFTQYGLSLDENGLSRLRTPAPNKSGIVVALATEHGSNTLSYPNKKEVRQISLGVHIHADTVQQFNTLYDNFCAQVLDWGYIRMKHSVNLNTVYHLKYVDCQPISYINGLALFTLTLEEPRPDIRTETGTIGIE